MTRLLTASKLDLIDRCVGAAVLPGFASSNEYSEGGHAIHGFLDRADEVGKGPALAEIEDDEMRARCEAIDVDAIPAGADSEVAFAYHVATREVRVLGQRLQRAYPDLGPGWIYGTADRAGVAKLRGIVLDFKTGLLKKRARESLQLGFFAVAVTDLHHLDAADVANLYLAHSGRWFPDRASFNSFDLGELRDTLASLLERVAEAQAQVDAGEMPKLHSGSWCEYCEAVAVCPAQRALVRAGIGGELSEIEERFAELTPAAAGIAWERVVLMEKLIGRAKEALRLIAKSTPDGLPLPDGRVLREVPYKKRTVDARVALRVLPSFGADMVERAAKFSLKAIEEEAGKDAVRAIAQQDGVHEVYLTKVQAVAPARRRA